ncbi:MAG: alpha/beta fold hydrolase [Bacilli bacterium]
MYYEIVGEGKPIVALHGWSLDHRVMKECLEPTFTHRSGWKRIYVDLPGMGRSPASDAIQSTDDILASVLRFIDAAIPGEEFAVCGESYGGYPFDKPALIITGRQDTSVGYVDSWNILDNYPRATFAVLDRAGHNLQIEQPNLFHALISEWLDRVQEAEQPPRGQ